MADITITKNWLRQFARLIDSGSYACGGYITCNNYNEAIDKAVDALVDLNEEEIMSLNLLSNWKEEANNIKNSKDVDRG